MVLRFSTVLVLLVVLLLPMPSVALRAVPESNNLPARLYILYARPPSSKPNVMLDGDVVKNQTRLSFMILNSPISIAPAGDMTPNTGHFHLLIDTVLTPEQMKLPIPNDAQHLHYGKGQTEATLTLPAGSHTLQLVLGDGAHKLHQPPVMTAPVTITVE